MGTVVSPEPERRAPDVSPDRFLVVRAKRSHGWSQDIVREGAALVRARGLGAMLLTLGGPCRMFLDAGALDWASRRERLCAGTTAAHSTKEALEDFRTANLPVQDLARVLSYVARPVVTCA